MSGSNLSRRALGLAALAASLPVTARAFSPDFRVWPRQGATGVNPDTQLRIVFPREAQLGAAGLLRIIDTADGSVVDTIDVAIPAGPDHTRRRQTGSPPDTTVYQQNTIGGMEGFHFRPVVVRGRIATITLHSGVLKYGRTYAVHIDPEVFSEGGFAGFKDNGAWAFSTKSAPPQMDATRLVVAADGSGDFNTVQGAVDFLPANPPRRVTIVIRPGDYEELVYIQGKSHLTIRGEDRQRVIVHYGNNSAFNAAKPRYAFALADCTDVQLSNFTINNDYIGQAEALMIRGERIIVESMTLNGSGDALQLRGSVYFRNIRLTGHGDTILSYGAGFFDACEIRSIGPVNWIRNPATNHGHVFKDCTFVALNEPLPWTRTADGGGQMTTPVLARLPDKKGINYPYAECVLLSCRLDGYPSEGWGPVEDRATLDWTNVKFWEFNSMDGEGRPLDMSGRHPIVRVLTLPKDAKIVADYSRPAFVLGGWTPQVR